MVAAAVGVALEVRRGSTPAPWHPGRCAELVVGGAVVGHAGELAPRVCESTGLPRRTSAMELDLGAVVAAMSGVVTARGLSSYPVAKEDVALVVDSAVPAAAVEAALVAGAGPLLESVRLFDVYTGEQVGEGRKSLAYALRFRAPGPHPHRRGGVGRARGRRRRGDRGGRGGAADLRAPATGGSAPA